MQCQLCGYIFDETSLSCHSSCAFNKHCAIICCPNCGYQVADVSKSSVVALLRRAFGDKSSAQSGDTVVDSRPLSSLSPGETGTILAIDSASASRLERLSVFGLMPGAEVTLEQRQPTFVLRVGGTELSVEREVADEILIEMV
jgi:Fe2+ transport system protein FeoA/rubredoxin